MLFQSKIFRTTWDTWMYFNDGIYYLYYLIAEKGRWSGFGVATSKDGVHYQDYGMEISASDKMVEFLGTGAVWKSVDYAETGKFICNYSEWRKSKDGICQNILFAESLDLIHWKKLGDSSMFSADERYYKSINGRWDCIYPLKTEKGYYGYYTATPNEHVSIGFGQSADGIHWQALPSPQIDLGPLKSVSQVEAGAAIQHNGKTYLMVGCIDHDSSMCFFIADNPAGPFEPMKKNTELFHVVNSREQNKIIKKGHNHAYFARFFSDTTNNLVNFHVLSKKCDEYGHPYTYLAPIKKVVFDEEGTLRLYWWEKNNALIGRRTNIPENEWIAEFDYICGSDVVLYNGEKELLFSIDQKGHFLMWNDRGIEMENYRDMNLNKRIKVRLLVRNEFLELYAADEYIGVYSAEHSFKPKVKTTEEVVFYKMNL